MSIFDDISDIAGSVIGTVCGIAVAPIAIALGVSVAIVKEAIRAGCRTQDEIKEWIEDNT